MRKVTRYLKSQVQRDLGRKMVFLAGPRQVGKTTLALGIAGARSGYLNWDIPEHRERILRGELPPSRLWVLDEIHKYRRWRNYLKGLYDGRPRGQRILVTGSGRLDLYRFGGDSLQGRYHCHLLKWVHYEQDTSGRDLELRYFRDSDGREVDFVVTERGKPLSLVECKWSDMDVDRGLRYLKTKFPAAEAWQISATGGRNYQTPEGIRVAPALELLGTLV